MWELLASVLLVTGGLFSLIASVGVLRMPDLYSRMHAATKVGAVGVTAIVLAVMIHFGDLSVSTRGLLIIGFILLTAPIAAHMIGRAAYLTRIPLWERTHINEWPKPPGPTPRAPE